MRDTVENLPDAATTFWGAATACPETLHDVSARVSALSDAVEDRPVTRMTVSAPVTGRASPVSTFFPAPHLARPRSQASLEALEDPPDAQTELPDADATFPDAVHAVGLSVAGWSDSATGLASAS